MKNFSRQKISTFNVFNTIFFAVIVFVMVYPLYYVVMGSFMTNHQFSNDHVHLLAKPFVLDAYIYMLKAYDFFTPYKNTLIICSVGTVISLLLTAMGGYVLSKKFLPGRNLVMALIIFTMIFSGGMIPSYLLVSELKLINTLWALIIPSAINTFYLIIMRTSFAAIPDSIEESAKIDGANYFTIFFRIILPLSKSILATIALFYIVDRWNDVMSGILYINNNKSIPLQVLLYRLVYESTRELVVGGYVGAEVSVKEIQKYASVVLSSVPILCVYPFLQKYFVKGVLIGGVKG